MPDQQLLRTDIDYVSLLSGLFTGAGRAVLSHSSVHDVDGDLRAFPSNQEARRGVVRQSHAGCAQKERLVIQEQTQHPFVIP